MLLYFSGSCCDVNSVCTCGTTSGHYACVCNPGYYGSGLTGQCNCMCVIKKFNCIF